MRDGFRQSMAWLHTWSGLLPGWVLYFVFLTGTLGYLDTEIDRWMQPELPRAHHPSSVDRWLPAALAQLEAEAPDARVWRIDLPIDRNQPYPRISWRGSQSSADGRNGEQTLDPGSGTVLRARPTGGGQVLYQMHWKLRYLPTSLAYWLVGIASMFMLVALLSGVIVHRRLFADFFLLRLGRGQRSWLDAHNVASVMALPFQFLITWSGLVFQMSIYLPLILAAAYGFGPDAREQYREEVFERPALPDPRGAPAPLHPVGEVLTAAETQLGDVAVRSLEVHNPGDANARFVLRGDLAAGPGRRADVLVFDGVDGSLLAVQEGGRSVAKASRDLLLGLHEGLFAGPALRGLYLLSGFLGLVMIGTGLLLWTRKRRARAERSAETRTLRLLDRVEASNVAVVLGLPTAVVGYFWANRLLPTDLPGRDDWEVHALFLTWFAMGVHAALRGARRAWAEQSCLAGALCLLLAVFDSVITVPATAARFTDPLFAGFLIALTASGAGFLTLAVRLRESGRRSSRETNAMDDAATDKAGDAARAHATS